MEFYGLNSCDTCRKALRELRESGSDPHVHDIRQDGLTQGQVERFHAAFGDRLINRRSVTWRSLTAAERAGDPVALVLRHPAAMTRPVVEHGARLYLGWGEEVRAALLR